MRRMATLLAVGLCGVLAATAARAAGPGMLKVGATMPVQSTLIAKGYVPWLRAVEKDAGDSLKVQEFWGGALVRAAPKQYEAMMNGLMDSTVIVTSYTQKLFPDCSLFSIPYVVNGAVEAAVGGWRLFEKGLLRGFDRVKVVAIFSNDNGGVHLRTPIETLDDLDGLKIRVSGPEEAEVIKALGGTPVALGIPSTPDALNRGVIDGTFNGWAANSSFHITPLIRSHIDAPFGVRQFFVGINQKAYDALPAKARAAIDKHSGRATSLMFGKVMDETGEPLVAAAEADPKRNVVRPTAAQAETLKRKFKALVEAWIAKIPDGARKYKEVEDAVAAYRASRS